MARLGNHSVLLRYALVCLGVVLTAGSPTWLKCQSTDECLQPRYKQFCDTNLGLVGVCSSCDGYCDGSEELKPNCEQHCALLYAEVYTLVDPPPGPNESDPANPPGEEGFEDPANQPEGDPEDPATAPEGEGSEDPASQSVVDPEGPADPPGGNSASTTAGAERGPGIEKDEEKTGHKFNIGLLAGVIIAIIALISVVGVAFHCHRQKIRDFAKKKYDRVKKKCSNGYEVTGEKSINFTGGDFVEAKLQEDAANRYRQQDMENIPGELALSGGKNPTTYSSRPTSPSPKLEVDEAKALKESLRNLDHTGRIRKLQSDPDAYGIPPKGP